MLLDSLAARPQLWQEVVAEQLWRWQAAVHGELQPWQLAAALRPPTSWSLDACQLGCPMCLKAAVLKAEPSCLVEPPWVGATCHACLMHFWWEQWQIDWQTPPQQRQCLLLQ